MSIKNCKSCALSEKTKLVCRLTGIPIDLEKDFCSKHAMHLNRCDLCGNPMVAPIYVSLDGALQYCGNCRQVFSTCQLCQNASKCEFETNPDPMPKVVVKTIQQNGMVMQAQVKNNERIQKFCPSCICWNKETECCMKEFNIGCSSRNS